MKTDTFNGYLGYEDWVWWCIIGGGSILLLGLFLCCCICCKRRKRKREAAASSQLRLREQEEYREAQLRRAQAQARTQYQPDMNRSNSNSDQVHNSNYHYTYSKSGLPSALSQQYKQEPPVLTSPYGSGAAPRHSTLISSSPSYPPSYQSQAQVSYKAPVMIARPKFPQQTSTRYSQASTSAPPVSNARPRDSYQLPMHNGQRDSYQLPQYSGHNQQSDTYQLPIYSGQNGASSGQVYNHTYMGMESPSIQGTTQNLVTLRERIDALRKGTNTPDRHLRISTSNSFHTPDPISVDDLQEKREVGLPLGSVLSQRGGDQYIMDRNIQSGRNAYNTDRTILIPPTSNHPDIRLTEDTEISGFDESVFDTAKSPLHHDFQLGSSMSSGISGISFGTSTSEHSIGQFDDADTSVDMDRQGAQPRDRERSSSIEF